VDHLIQRLGWEPEMVSVEALDLTPTEKEEIAKTNRPSEWFTGPREPLGNEPQKSTQSCNLLEMNNHSAFEAGLA
jgi:DNA polymerase III psi subunit